MNERNGRGNLPAWEDPSGRYGADERCASAHPAPDAGCGRAGRGSPDERSATVGKLFFCEVMGHLECLVGLPPEAYLDLMAEGFGPEEVGLTVRRAGDGGFFKGDPPVRMWGELLVAKVDGAEKYQVRISGAEVKRLQAAGYRDLDEVRVGLEKLPHTSPSRELCPDDFDVNR